MEHNELAETGITWTPLASKHWDIKKGKFVFRSVKEINSRMQCKDRLALTLHGVIDRSEGDRIGLNPNDLRTYQIFQYDELVFKLLDLDNKKTSRVGYVHKKGIMSSAYIRVLNNPKMNMRYFYYQYFDLYQRFVFNNIGQGVRATMSSSDLLNMTILVPPLETQNAIVEYLDRKTKQIQEFISKKERLIDLLEEQRREFIDQQFNDLSKYETLRKPLKYLVNFISEQTNKIKESETYLALENIESWTGKIDTIIGSGEFDSSVKQFKKTDILFNKLRPYLAKVVIPDFDGVCVGELLVLRPTKETLKEFLHYKLISRRFIDLVDSSTFGSKMPRASWNFIGKVEIEYPIDYKNQSLIVSIIKTKELQLKSLARLYKSEIKKIKEYQESLITNIVTGKLKVPANTVSNPEFVKKEGEI
jgi:type I restriction enzyme S subunit